MSALALLWKYTVEAAILPKGNITANTEIPLEALIKKIISNCPKMNHMTSSRSEEKCNRWQGKVKNIR